MKKDETYNNFITLLKDIKEKFPCIVSNEVFDREHSIEVQLPFLQHIFSPKTQSAIDFVKGLKKIGRKIRIVPIMVGNCDFRLISDLISTYWENSSFVMPSLKFWSLAKKHTSIV